MTESVEKQPSGSATNAEVNTALQALRAVVQASMAFRRRFARHYDLTATDMIAMSHLAASGTLGAGELAIRTGMPTSSVTTVLDRLEHVGLIARTAAPGDRRSVQITFTDAGLAALHESEAWTMQALLKIGPENLPEFTRCLRLLAGELRRVTAAAYTDDKPDGTHPPA